MAGFGVVGIAWMVLLAVLTASSSGLRVLQQLCNVDSKALRAYINEVHGELVFV